MGKGRGWHGERKRHSDAARGIPTVVPMHGKSAVGWKTELARDLTRDGFGPNVNVIFRRLSKEEKILKEKWDMEGNSRFRRDLSYRAGLGAGARIDRHTAIKRVAASQWFDLSDDTKTMLLMEYAYGEPEGGD